MGINPYVVPSIEQALVSKVGFNRLKASLSGHKSDSIRDSLLNTDFYTGSNEMTISDGCQV